MQSWNSSKYVWDAKHYDNITHTVVKASQLMDEPNLIVRNTHSATAESRFCRPDLCAIRSDGNVACTMPCEHKMGCRSSNQNWPHENQNCSMTVAVEESQRNQTLRLASDLRVDRMDSQDTHWRLTDFVAMEAEGRLYIDVATTRHTTSYLVAIVRPTFGKC